MPGSGAAAAPPGTVPAFFRRHQRHLRRVHRSGGALRHRRKLAGHHPYLASVRLLPHRAGRSDPPPGARNHRPDHQRGGQLQQGIRQAGQRLQKAGRHDGDPAGGRGPDRLAAAGGGSFVCGPCGGRAAGPAGHPHHRAAGGGGPGHPDRQPGQAGGGAEPLRPGRGRGPGASGGLAGTTEKRGQRHDLPAGSDQSGTGAQRAGRPGGGGGGPGTPTCTPSPGRSSCP